MSVAAIFRDDKSCIKLFLVMTIARNHDQACRVVTPATALRDALAGFFSVVSGSTSTALDLEGIALKMM